MSCCCLAGHFASLVVTGSVGAICIVYVSLRLAGYRTVSTVGILTVIERVILSLTGCSAVSAGGISTVVVIYVLCCLTSGFAANVTGNVSTVVIKLVVYTYDTGVCTVLVVTGGIAVAAKYVNLNGSGNGGGSYEDSHLLIRASING